MARHKRKADRFKAKHPEGRKAFSRMKRARRHARRLIVLDRRRNLQRLRIGI